jgi:hypothetical protein|tara:strand:+ start:292 stop:1200 length:909 start_codon:yes stop_codon:yes gene_type:complete
MQSIETLSNICGRITKIEVLKRAADVFKTEFKSAAHLFNKYHNQKLIICGGGPSLNDTFKNVRKQAKSNRVKILAVNKTHDWLIKRGIKPDFGVLIDPKPWVKNYIKKPIRGVIYLLGAKLDPSVWSVFKNNKNTFHWHPLEFEEEATLVKGLDTKNSGYALVPGQATVGLRSVALAYELGFREIELHGIDSSSQSGKSHAYQKHTDSEVDLYDPWKDNPIETVQVDSPSCSRTYVCTRQMASQIQQFKTMVSEFDILEQQGAHEITTITVAGTGAIPYLAAAGYGLHVRDDYNKDPESMPK